MEASRPTIEPETRNQGLLIDELRRIVDTEPNDYEVAWNELRHFILEIDDHAGQTVPALVPSALSLAEARQMFNLFEMNDVLWADIEERPAPRYLSDNVERILAVTSNRHQTYKAFSRTMIDQFLLSALYEESTQTFQQQTSPHPEEPTVLTLRHEMRIERQVTFEGQSRLLSGSVDTSVWHESDHKSSLATNLIIIEAEKAHYTDTCLGQLTALMGAVHASKKDKQEGDTVVYGVASDGFSFRFCRIDNESNWSESRLLELQMGDKDKIYNVFRAMIREAAISSPSDSPITVSKERRQVTVAFGSPERDLKLGHDLSALELLEEDDETEIISFGECS